MKENPRSTLGKRIEVLRGKVSPAAEVRRMINEASEVTATKEDVTLFLEAVAKGDNIALYHLRRKEPWPTVKQEWLGLPRHSLTEKWLSLSWEEWLRQIRSLAESDSFAREAIEVYETFATNPLLLKELQEVLTTFERPCRVIHTKEEIIAFLERLVARGLAEKTSRHPRRRAIHWGHAWYAPKRGVPLARLGWIFVVRATIRVQRRETAKKELLERLQPLFDISVESDPEDLGLTRLINGEYGVVTIWEDQSWWNGQNQGLFAVALEQNRCGSWLIKGVVSDQSFPENIINMDYELPLLVVEETKRGLWARFGNLHGLGKEEFRFVKQVEKLIQRRLATENQATAQQEQESEVEPATV